MVYGLGQSESCSSCVDFDSGSGDLEEEHRKVIDMDTWHELFDIWENGHTPRNEGSSCGIAIVMW